MIVIKSLPSLRNNISGEYPKVCVLICCRKSIQIDFEVFNSLQSILPKFESFYQSLPKFSQCSHNERWLANDKNFINWISYSCGNVHRFLDLPFWIFSECVHLGSKSLGYLQIDVPNLEFPTFNQTLIKKFASKVLRSQLTFFNQLETVKQTELKF